MSLPSCAKHASRASDFQVDDTMQPPHRPQPERPSRHDLLAPITAPRRARPGRSRGEVLVVLATIALVVLPVALVEWPREIARWHLAAAMELNLAG